jgi:hypothetical protein
MTRVLPTDSGRDAVSVMAQQFGLAMAATWRDASLQAEDPGEANRLRSQALASEGLAGLVNTVWRIDGYGDILRAISESEPVTYEVDDPNARVDLRGYLRCMTAYADALGVAMSQRFDEFKRAILLPVWEFSPQYAMVTNKSWTFELKFWGNLLTEQSVSHSEMNHRIQEEATTAPPEA